MTQIESIVIDGIIHANAGHWEFLMAGLDTSEMSDFLFEVSVFAKPEQKDRITWSDLAVITSKVLEIGDSMPVSGKACLCTACYRIFLSAN